MRLFLITSNKFTNVCPINIHFLNKYWAGQEIVLLGYEEVLHLKNLPKNVTVEYLGKQESFGKSWTDALIPYFNNISDEYFFLLMDDFILLKPANKEQIALLETQIKTGKAQKAVAGGGLPLASTEETEKGILKFNQGIDYRATLHPAIWNRKYFLKFLRPNLTAWQFELDNNTLAKYDGANIVNNKYSYPREPHPFSALNLYNKGKLTIDKEGNILDSQPSEKFFNKKDIKHIWEKLHAS